MGQFEAGKPRHPNAGRKKGTPNRATLPIEERCRERGADPIQVLIDCLSEPEHKLAAAKELAQYLYPKRRALEIDSSINVELAKKAEEYQNLSTEQQIEIMEVELKRLKGECHD